MFDLGPGSAQPVIAISDTEEDNIDDHNGDDGVLFNWAPLDVFEAQSIEDIFMPASCSILVLPLSGSESFSVYQASLRSAEPALILDQGLGAFSATSRNITDPH